MDIEMTIYLMRDYRLGLEYKIITIGNRYSAIREREIVRVA